jgi:hypothetical protein
MLRRVLPASMSRPVEYNGFWVVCVDSKDTPGATKVAERLSKVPSIVLKRVAKMEDHSKTRVLICREVEATKEMVEQHLEKAEIKGQFLVKLAYLIDEVPPMQVLTAETGSQCNGCQRMATFYQDPPRHRHSEAN